jgi:hypothetical protein
MWTARRVTSPDVQSAMRAVRQVSFIAVAVAEPTVPSHGPAMLVPNDVFVRDGSPW